LQKSPGKRDGKIGRVSLLGEGKGDGSDLGKIENVRDSPSLQNRTCPSVASQYQWVETYPADPNRKGYATCCNASPEGSRTLTRLFGVITYYRRLEDG
jgi:hypothetical protein